MENKQTAVEWLVNVVQSCIVPDYIPKEIIDQAKAMEKEQIMDAYTADCDTLGHTNAFKVAAEQYYNETYSSGRTESIKSE